MSQRWRIVLHLLHAKSYYEYWLSDTVWRRINISGNPAEIRRIKYISVRDWDINGRSKPNNEKIEKNQQREIDLYF